VRRTHHILLGLLLAGSPALAQDEAPAPETAGEAAPAPAEAPAAAITGTVKLVGSGPAKTTSLSVSRTEAYDLTGPLAAELKRIPGATVAVTGTISGEGARRKLAATDYEITDVGGGIRPYVGTLRVEGGFVFLDVPSCGCTRVLTGKAALRFAEDTGAKIWVSGIEHENNVLEVLRSGTLAKAP